MYGKSADKFLSLIPECCRQNAAPSAERDEDGAPWGKGEQQSGERLKAVMVNLILKLPEP